jgi:hypothetical protein
MKTLLILIAALLAAVLLWPSFAMPSITAVLIAVDWIVNRDAHRQLRRQVIFVAGAIAFVLYASVIGFLPIDLYALGFSPFAPLVLAAAGVWLARSHREAAWIILAVLLAYDVSLVGSRNLFDYAVDPVLLALAIFFSAAGLTALLRGHRGRALIEVAAVAVRNLREALAHRVDAHCHRLERSDFAGRHR